MNELKKITLILRGYTTNQTLLVAREASKMDCFNIEITTNTNDWEKQIQLIRNEYPSVSIGAGTVLNMELLERAKKSGAQFALSAIPMSYEMLNYCRENKIISIPGAFSPNEIYDMYSHGADIVKLFPAVDLPDRYIKDIFAPLGKMPIMVVGGINNRNVNKYFENGASYAGIGSGICDKSVLNKDSIKELIDNLSELKRISISL